MVRNTKVSRNSTASAKKDFLATKKADFSTYSECRFILNISAV